MSSPSGLSTGTTHRSTPRILRPSSRPLATYCPKFSSPCMVATTITTGLPFSPARYAVIGRPSAEVPIVSLWYQVRGPVASSIAWLSATRVRGPYFPVGESP